MVALVVGSTVGTVCNGRFVGSALGGDGGVALWMRWGSVASCRWIRGLVRLYWT